MATTSTQPETSANALYQASFNQLPETGYIKLSQIVGQKSGGKYKRARANIPALIPVSRTTFLSRVKSGEYPKPVRLGER